MHSILHVLPDNVWNDAAQEAARVASRLEAVGWRCFTLIDDEERKRLPAILATKWPDDRLDTPSIVHCWRRSIAHLLRRWWNRGQARLIVSLEPGSAELRLHERVLLNKADAVVTATAAEAAILARYGIESARCAMIPYSAAPPDTPNRAEVLRRLRLPEDVRLIFCAGEIGRNRGFREAVWIFDILRYVYSDLWLVVAGRGRERAGVEEFARSLGREDMRVCFVDDSPDDAALVGLAEVVWVFGAQGGYSTALQAMAAGCPVVARARPDLCELWGDEPSPFLIPSADRHETARATRRLLDDADLWKRESAAAKKRVIPHDVDRVADRWIELYARLADRQC